jgi:acyl-CoA thioester hydrolase
MSDYRFFHPTEIRYGDLDPQGHVNNAKQLTYFEHARVQYFVKLGMFRKDQSFMEIGVIVADIHITYHKPIHWMEPVQTGVKVTKIGNKSMLIDQAVVNTETGEVLSSGTVVLVAYDYSTLTTRPVPEAWREAIHKFEGLPLAGG